ncbi:MAG: cytochrome c-type biogenesis protein CcmH, partial [Chloroflexota bacterium]|nr:cytochrome c-type biogenesis protein CcmH [Chloroflexota bacterium]
MSLKLRIAVSAFSFLALGLLLASPARAQTPTVDQMSQELVCGCGCNAVLGNCLHETCGVRDNMMAEVKQQVAQGKSKDEMLRFFVAKYGTQVLSAPPKQG